VAHRGLTAPQPGRAHKGAGTLQGLDSVSWTSATKAIPARPTRKARRFRAFLRTGWRRPDPAAIFPRKRRRETAQPLVRKPDGREARGAIPGL
jgi:hypothetical protein